MKTPEIEIIVQEFVAVTIEPGAYGYPHARDQLKKVGIIAEASDSHEQYSFAGEISAYVMKLKKPVKYKTFLDWKEICKHMGWYLNEDKGTIKALKLLSNLGSYDEKHESPGVKKVLTSLGIKKETVEMVISTFYKMTEDLYGQEVPQQTKTDFLEESLNVLVPAIKSKIKSDNITDAIISIMDEEQKGR
jgi:hypothetical protein